MIHLKYVLKLAGAVIVAAVLSVFLHGCTPAQKALATCVVDRTATTCVPQCAACVRSAVESCKASAQAAAPKSQPSVCKAP